MRTLATFAILGSFLVVTSAQAQSLAEHAAAASGATIGTAAGKPLSNAITKIFGQTDNSAKKAASATVNSKTSAKPEAEPAVPVVPPAGASSGAPSSGSTGESTPARHGGFARHPAASQYTSAIVPPAAVESIAAPARKEPTAEEVASIHVGATEQELVATLGQPESKVTIPDDGHLLEICQYWSKGQQIGTVRLDNGQVVNVESRKQN